MLSKLVGKVVRNRYSNRRATQTRSHEANISNDHDVTQVQRCEAPTIVDDHDATLTQSREATISDDQNATQTPIREDTMSNQSKDTQAKEEEKRYYKLREKAGRFRVLIIGGANAGKTTILQKICNTTDDPEIMTGGGEKIDLSAVQPIATRGYHDIENEMVFQSNPTFIFHDSRGFEAGGVDEFKRAKLFVAERAKMQDLSEQIHAIWYCIAMDDDRPVTYAEKQFFSQSGTGQVPVIAVFTKCEALELKAITALVEQGYDFDEAAERAHDYVEENYKNTHKMLEVMEFPPKGHVYLQELDKPENGCHELVKCTAEVLDNKALQGLFISTQQNSLELQIGYSLRQSVCLGLYNIN